MVTHRRSDCVGDLEQEVRKLITGSQENVSFITWSAHMVTNEYVDVSKVIHAGTLFFRPSYHEALKRLAPISLRRNLPRCYRSVLGPIERTRHSHVKAAVEQIEEWLSSAKVGDIPPFKRLTKALGITSHHFKNNVREHAEFVEAIAELGVVEWGPGV